MKRLLIPAILIAVCGTTLAEDRIAVPAQADLEELLERSAHLTLDKLTVSDLVQVQTLEALAREQTRYVHKATRLSLILPGLGHLAIGERGTALAFAGAEITLAAAALTGAYFLLPAPVRIANLNYLQTPISDIEAVWKSLTPADFIGPLGVMVTGSILRLVVRSYASRSAGEAARTKLWEEEVEFELSAGR